MTLRGILLALGRVAAFLLLFFAFAMIFGAGARYVPRPQSFVGSLLFNFTLVLAAVATAQFIMLRLIEKRPWSDIGLGAAQAAPRLLAFGLALGAFGILIPSLLLLGAHWLGPGQAAPAAGSSVLFGLQMAALMLPQSFAEELLSRGYGFAALREGAGAVAAVAVSSAVFGMAHLRNPNVSAESVASVVLAGVFLGALVIVTGSVYAAWMAHFAWNFAIAGVLHAKLSGITFPAPGWQLVETGPPWVTGGAWGPEGGVAACAGMLGVLATLAWWHRRAAPTAAPELSHG